MRSRHHVITLVLLAAACEPTRRRTPDDTLVMVIESAMTTADPRFAVSSWDSKLTRLVTTGLTVVESPTLEPELYLAAKLEPVPTLVPVSIPTVVAGRIVPLITAVAIEGVAWDVTLRDDARFSDGSPVTADDVVYTYETVLSPSSKSLHHKGFTDRYAAVEALGPRRVRFWLKQPLATLRSDLDFGIVSRSGLGSGPFVLRELTSTHALLDANPHFFGAKPRTAHLQIKFVRDAAARLLMLVGGSADVIQNSVRMDLIEEVRTRPRVKIDSASSVILTYMMLNNADPRLADPRVRQAIALAIDRPALVQAKFGGHAKLATGLLPPQHWAYHGDVPRWDRDLARARRLLDEAGHPDPDGDGPRPRFSLVYKTSSDAFRVSIARLIAAQLAEIGIDVEVRSFEFGTFFADIKRGAYQLASMQSAELNEPDYYFFYFHSSRIPDAANPDGGNRWRYRNPEVDRLTELGRRELDVAKRKAIYADVQRLVAAEVPIIALWHEDNVVLTNIDVSGYRITPNARLVGLASAFKTSP